MYITKNFTIRRIITFTGFHLIWLSIWSLIVIATYELTGWEWMKIPWLPLSVIGTAVAFYVGFKNNQSYDRVWEARKIWGAIVNNSRAWGSIVKAFIGNQFREEDLDDEEIFKIKKRLIYRHIGWLYTLRKQLLIPESWEHVNQGFHIGKINRKRIENFGTGLFEGELSKINIQEFLPADEYERLINYKNTATQIIDQQAQDLENLRSKDLIDDFRHLQLQAMLNKFYDEQGKCERIKKFPLPRQYGAMSFVFVGIFIYLLPFGMIGEFIYIEHFGPFVGFFLTILVSWIYIVMELIGDYSENPFEGLSNDIPMLSICRTIEIDLREMLGEKDVPPKIEAKSGVLM